MKILLAVLLMFPTSLLADDWSFSSNVSEQGISVNIGKKLLLLPHSTFSAQLFSYKDLIADKRVKNNSWLDFSSAGVLLDWHPGQTAFRVTVGGFYNERTLGQDVSSNFLRLNEEEFNRASIGYGSNASYLGVGWEGDDAVTSGWGMALDLGVLYQSPETLSANCAARLLVVSCVSSGTINGSGNNLSGSEWSPVMSFGVRYRF